MTQRISPTAHYTGEVWIRHGLGDPALGTPAGRALYGALRPLSPLSSALLGGLTLERYLLDRHLALDRLLARAIEAGALQVLEIAAGLSPRGYRFAQRYREAGLRYIEGELPPMARRKREALWRADLQPPNHTVLDADLLVTAGPRSLEAIMEAELDPEVPAALVIEGLLSYFDGPVMGELWPRLAQALGRFPRGLLLANTELRSEAGSRPLIRAFALALSRFAAAPVRFHFLDEAEAVTTLSEAGFPRVALHRPSDLLDREVGPQVVRLVAATTGKLTEAP